MENSSTHLPAAEDLPVLTIAEVDADPHGVFRHWRRTHPFVAHEAGGYIVLRHADVTRLSGDPRLRSTETGFPQSRGITQGPLFDMFQYGMLTANDGVHARRRAPMSRTFAVQIVDELRPHIRRSAEDLINAFYDDGHAEFVSQFAAHIPAHTLASLLGLPREDIPSFTRLVYDVGRFFSPSSTQDDIHPCEAAAEQLQDYVENILHERRRAPRGDFLSTFLAEADEGTKLSALEMIVQIIQLIIGGTESVRAAIVAQTAVLLLHRDQWKAVCGDPGLIPAAVSEAMRFEPGIAGMVRFSAEDIDIDGLTLPAGQLVTLSTMSAMRDENAYKRPDEFNIHRSDLPRLHPVFGGGAHRCIAEAVARVELEVCLAALTARIPHLRLEEIPVFKGHIFVRSMSSMCVSWDT
ncbi:MULTISPECIES: cytochrome P450 [unclassified Sinorhizobium]|uniref:cytochrome P450 n=1 Tax=unclassified Sinorhizobium TaxID=2613772 RepID=UPI00352342A5